MHIQANQRGGRVELEFLRRLRTTARKLLYSHAKCDGSCQIFRISTNVMFYCSQEWAREALSRLYAKQFSFRRDMQSDAEAI